ncbi:MAG: chemotaxis protein CheD [Deltaproteobacteria bacterium]|nr:chemotaxis protein CheD [Deltaproteobacteria bacterium]
MSQEIVGISDVKVSRDPNNVLITYALGSCIGITVFDPSVKVGGLLHFMLPTSSLDLDKARKKPAMFADTGIPLLFKSCYKLGANKKRMIVKIAGGASVLDNENYFRIGEKNITAVRKIFWKNKVMVSAEDIGDNYNRTVTLHLSTGQVLVKNRGTIIEL